jgi:hypothetical protein
VVDAGELPWVFFLALALILMQEVLSNLSQLLVNFPSSIQNRLFIRTLELTKPFVFPPTRLFWTVVGFTCVHVVVGKCHVIIFLIKNQKVFFWGVKVMRIFVFVDYSVGDNFYLAHIFESGP